MSKVKKTLVILTGLTALSLTGIGLFVSTIDPNDYKDELSTFFSEKTGFQISLDGNIDLRLFPNPSLTIQDIHFIKIEKGLSIESTIGQTHLNLNWAPLLRRNLVVESLSIKDLKMDLIQDPKIVAGSSSPKQTSLEKIEKEKSDPSNVNQTNDKTNLPASTAKNNAINFNLKKLTISDSTINKTDKITGQDLTLDSLQIEMGSLSPSSPFKLKSKFNANVPGVLNKSAFSFDLEANVTESKVIIENAELLSTLLLKDKPPLPLELLIKGDINLGQSFIFNTFNVTLNGSKIKGNLAGLLGESPKFTFAMTSQKIDVAKIMTGTPSTAKIPTNNTLKDSDIATPKLPQASQRAQFMGSFSSQMVVGDNWIASNVKTDISKTNDELNFKNLELDVYQGHLKTDVTLVGDRVRANGQLNQVNVRPLLIELKDFKKISGLLSTSFNIETRGNDIDTRLKALKGQMDYSLEDGYLEGVDISYIFSEIKSRLKKKENAKTDSGRTEFVKAMGHLNFDDGMVKTEDLTFVSYDYRAVGSGTFQHTDQYLDLNFDVSKLNDDEEVIKEIPIGLKVYGHAPNIHFKPDYEGYALSVAKKAITKKAEKIIDKFTDKIIDKLGLDKETKEGSSNQDDKNKDDEPLADKINDKVKHKLNRFLDKLQ